MFAAIIIAMAVCVRIAMRSGKRDGVAAARLLAPLMFPMIGNMIIILSGNRTLSLIGCYLYYLGLDFQSQPLFILPMYIVELSTPENGTCFWRTAYLRSMLSNYS